MRCIFSKKKNITFVVFCLLILINVVSAVTVDSNYAKQKSVCITNNGNVGENGLVYKIIYPGSDVKTGLIVNSDVNGNIKNCFCSKGGGCSSGSSCNSTYSFSSQYSGETCAITSKDESNGSYEFAYCLDKNNEYVPAAASMTLPENMRYDKNGSGYNVVMKLSDRYKKYANDIKVYVCAGENCEKNAANSNNGLPSDDPNIYPNITFTPYNVTESGVSVYIPAGQKFYFIFKAKTKPECNDTYIYFYQSGTSNADVTDNPDYNGSICTQLRNYEKISTEIEKIRKTVTDESKLQEQINAKINESMIPYCYQTQVNYSVVNEMHEVVEEGKTAIQYQWEAISEMMQSQTEENLTSGSTTVCSFNKDLNSKNINSDGKLLKSGEEAKAYKWTKTGKYWAITCTETAKVSYDRPIAVEGGQGFEYNTNVTVERTCSMKRVSTPKMKDRCTYVAECYGRPGDSEHQGKDAAGPNEEFDSCVYDCDGGKYTQNCINNCYKKVYENDDKYSYDLSNNVNNKDYSISRIECDSYPNTPSRSWNCVARSNHGGSCWSCEGSDCHFTHGNKATFQYEDVCNSDNWCYAIACYEVYTSSGDCSDDPEAEYKKALNASYNEWVTMHDTLRKLTVEGETYEIKIDEEYSCNKGKCLTNTTYYSTNDNSLVSPGTPANRIYKTETAKEEVINDKKISIASKKYSHLGKKEWFDPGLDVSTVKVTREINLKIGSAYIRKNGVWSNKNKMDDDTLRKEGILKSSQNVKYNRTSDLTNTTLDNDSSVYGPYNKYFTNILTKVNVNQPLPFDKNGYPIYDISKVESSSDGGWPYYNPYVSINEDTTKSKYVKNIDVYLVNVGTQHQWGKISTNTTKGKQKSSGEPIDIKCFYGTTLGGAVCDDDSCGSNKNDKGIQYIFRPIELSDVFPNGRDPRFNWTGYATQTTSVGAGQKATESLYGSIVSPEILTENIQNKTDRIYDIDSSEVDYVFVLTSSNIRAIKNYNKNVQDINGDGSRNYLDYDMNCKNYTNSSGVSREICFSKFLDNIRVNSGDNENAQDSNLYVTYGSMKSNTADLENRDSRDLGRQFTIDSRHQIAVCNNSRDYGTKCDTDVHVGGVSSE